MKRVLLFNNLPAPYFIPLFRRLGEVAGWDLTICYATRWKSDLGWPGELAAEANAPGTLYLEDAGGVIRSISRIFGGTVGTILATLMMLWRVRPDYLICYGYTLTPQVTMLLHAMISGTKFSIIGDANIHCDHARGVRKLVKRLWLGLLTRRAAAVLTIGTANRRFWESYGVRKERLFAVPFSVDNRYFAEQAEERAGEAARWRERLGLTGRVVFLYVGRLVARKHIDLLIRSIRQLDGERAALVIAGWGEERGSLERLADGDPRVCFVGGVAPGELPVCYAMADALALVARDEPWGLVINEAMACGLPIIAHRECGAAADLVDEENGIVIESHSVDEVAAAMRRMVEEPELRRRLQAGSRRRIENWNIDATAAGIIRAVEATAGDGQSGR